MFFNRKNKMDSTCSVCNNSCFVLDYKCKVCGNVLRERVSVINFGEVFLDLMLDIDSGVKKVLYAEKKNYVFILLILLSIKLTILTLFDISFLDLNNNLKSTKLVVEVFVAWFICLILLSFFLKSIFFAIKKRNVSFKVATSIITYANLFFALSIFVLFPLELMLFGVYLFSNNPSIFEINLLKAISIISIEVLIIAYSIFLLFRFIVFILKQRFFAYFITIITLTFLYFGNELIKEFLGIK